MTDTVNTSTRTAADFASEAQFLLDHPNLPTPRGFDFVTSGGIYVILHTAEQVAQWADAIGAEVGTTEYQGNTHHSANTFEPFYVSAVAIVAPAEVSA